MKDLFISKKGIVVLVLIIVITGSWSYAWQNYEENKEQLIIYIDDLTRSIALPYRVVQMTLREPFNELPVPVHGVTLIEISDTWGEAREIRRTHEGTDIFAERGTPVFSATEGYIIRRNIGSRGGVNVMVIGPGGIMYYYAHFERIAHGIEPGAYVTPDTVLGFVGNSGNASGTPPHLHFGVYERRWDAVNPYPLLIERPF